MKNTINFLGIIAFTAIMSFSMTACGDPDEPSNSKFVGTWTNGTNGRIEVHNNGKWNQYLIQENEEISCGTYKMVSDTKVEFTMTHGKNQGQWVDLSGYTKAEVEAQGGWKTGVIDISNNEFNLPVVGTKYTKQL